VESQSFEPESVLAGFSWWGIASFFRCPVDLDPANCDVAVVGVPHSSGNGSTERDQHLGPRAVRNVSASHRRPHQQFGFSPWESVRVNDLGDVVVPEAMDNEATLDRIIDRFREIAAAGTRPISIGGDHSIAGAILTALGGSPLTGGQPLAVLQLDAHADANDQLGHWLGVKRSAAHWAAYTARDGSVDASRSVQIGLRGNKFSPDWKEASLDLGYRVIEMSEVRELGVARCAEIVRERVGDSPLYVSFDLDCLDPAIAPGVSNLEIGENGFSIDEANQMLRALRGLDVVGGDVVCLMPTKDNAANTTSMAAAAVAFELVALVADRLASAR
jgi:guanidinopropionase